MSRKMFLQGKGRADKKPTGRFGDMLVDKPPPERLPGRMEVKRIKRQEKTEKG